MPLRTGTLDMASLLEIRTGNIADFGLDRITESFQAELAIHNGLMTEMVSGLCFMTTDTTVTYGGSADGEMVEADEYARVPTQVTEGFGSFDIPFRSFQYGIGWTSEWFKRSTPADLAQAVLNAQDAHIRRVMRDIRRALFVPTNYTFVDYAATQRQLNVKRLLNADGMAIPMGPYGKVFDAATHTHYDAIDWNAATTQQRGDALVALAEDVVEHGHQSRVVIVIARSDEAKVRTATGFQPYIDQRVIAAPGQPEQQANPVDLENRAIGIIGIAEVWVKPWGQPNYPFAYDSGAPSDKKPLAFRQEAATSLQGLRTVAKISAYPLEAEYMKADFGIGVKERTNGAVLYLGGGTYVAPADNVLG